jgi:hypothetical protein
MAGRSRFNLLLGFELNPCERGGCCYVADHGDKIRAERDIAG